MAILKIAGIDNPKLRTKPCKGGMLSLYLEYYLGCVKEKDPETGELRSKPRLKREFLGLRMYAKPTTPIEKEHNKEVEIQAKLRQELAWKEFKNGQGFAFEVEDRSKLNFYDWLVDYVRTYSKADVRTIKGAIKEFRHFIEDNGEYKRFTSAIAPKNVTTKLCEGFADYLQNNHEGEGASTYWKRFHKIIRVAVKEGLFIKDPCEGILVSMGDGGIKKDVLTKEEVEALRQTPYCGNEDVANAFLFCIDTGARWGDVRELTWGNIDVDNKMCHYVQNKVKGHSKAASVDVPLVDETIERLGTPQQKDKKLFPDLPTSNGGANKDLKRWVESAGIKKVHHNFA